MAVWPGRKMKYLVVHPTEVIIVVITRVAVAAADVFVVVVESHKVKSFDWRCIAQ